MKKVIRLTESNLVNLIEKVIQEQATPAKTPQECAMLRKKSEKNKMRAQRVISFAPKQLRDIISKAFDAGVKQGPEAFKSALPMEGKQALEKKLKSIKKPKTDSELEQLISAAQSEASNIQEQVKSWLGLFVNIGMLLMVLMVLIIIIRGADGDIAGYCG
jgi:hypothetical protein